MDEEKTKKEERLDEWADCWIERKFPKNMDFNEYSDWKRFFNFWDIVYPELPMKVAFTIYLLKLKEQGVELPKLSKN